MNRANTPKEEPLYHTETLIAYIRGRLPADQMEKIALEMKRSEVLYTKIEGVRFLLEEEGREEGVDQFLKDNWELHTKQIEHYFDKQPKQKLLWPYLLAASVAIILLIGFFATRNGYNTNPDPDLIVQAELEEPFVVGLSVRGPDEKLHTWQNLYKQKDFDAVIDLLKDKEGKSELEQLYIGLSYMYLEKYEEAIVDFDLIEQTKLSHRFKEPAQWFSALCQYKLGQQSETKQKLQQIVKGRHWYHAEAQNLLDQF